MKNNIRKKLYIIIFILIVSLIPTKYVYSDSRDINWYNSSYTRIYPKLVKTYNLSKGKEDINRSSFGLQGSKYDFYNYGMQAMTVTDKYIVFALVYNPNNSNSDTIQNNKENTLIVIADKNTFKVYNVVKDYCFGHASNMAYNPYTKEILITTYPWHVYGPNQVPTRGATIASFKISDTTYQLTDYHIKKEVAYDGLAYDYNNKNYIAYYVANDWATFYDLGSNFEKAVTRFSTSSYQTSQGITYGNNHVYEARFEAGSLSGYQHTRYSTAQKYSGLIHEYNPSNYSISRSFYISGKDLYGELDNIAIDGSKMYIGYQFDHGTPNDWKISFYTYDLKTPMNGWQRLTFTNGTNWYYFRNGKPLTGWQYLEYNSEKRWYYFNNNGEMITGWKYLDYQGKKGWYYFCESNVCTPSGAMLIGLKNLKFNGRTDLYYLREIKDKNGIGPSGEMVVGLQTIAGKTYYFRTKANEISTGPMGSAIKNTCILKNKDYYCFGSNGVMTSKTAKQVIPTSNIYCKNGEYTGKEQLLTKNPGVGYTFTNNIATEAGNYSVTAKLKSGYVWFDGTLDNKIFTCFIKDNSKNKYVISKVKNDLSDVEAEKVTYKVYGSSDEDIKRVEAKLNIDPEYFEVKSVKTAKDWEGTYKDGTFDYKAKTEKTGSFEILTIELLPKKKGTTSIKLQNGQMNNGKIKTNNTVSDATIVDINKKPANKVDNTPTTTKKINNNTTTTTKKANNNVPVNPNKLDNNVVDSNDENKNDSSFIDTLAKVGVIVGYVFIIGIILVLIGQLITHIVNAKKIM